MKSVSLIGGGTKTYGYDQNGNRTHENGAQQIWYNAFNKPTRINRNGANLYFYYGADQMRYKQVNQTSGKTTLYIDKLFEKITGGGETQYRHFIGDIAVLTTTDNGSETTHKIGFSHRDRLGSAAAVGDEAGNLKESHSFDPFGKPRQGNILDKDTAILESAYSTRGFTDHEHLDDVELIHMNGRAYDYNLGRFLSVDPIIQSPGNSQSLNPYSYIMNNPLAGTDPSGYVCAASRLEGVCGSLPSHWGGNGGGRAKKRSDGFNQAKFENPLNGAVTAVLEGVGLQSTDIGSQASRENLQGGDQSTADSGEGDDSSDGISSGFFKGIFDNFASSAWYSSTNPFVELYPGELSPANLMGADYSSPYEAPVSPEAQFAYDLALPAVIAVGLLARNPMMSMNRIPSVAPKGRLRIDSGEFSQSEQYAAWFMASQGKKVHLRQPQGTRAGGGTSDLLVDGVRYDVYTPTTGNPSRIISAMAKKNSQTEGIVLDLSHTKVTPTQLGDALGRVNGAGAVNIKDIVIIGN
ncbi:RHS repeat-associated core domain-containing protein [Microbulbifer sp. CnH-101-E]|uniref:RHS repeat-associated core domain-containing protein n=1 Tax=unclassified Microbulbifer TaxID=2619833 RepID=UPI00403A21AF